MPSSRAREALIPRVTRRASCHRVTEGSPALTCKVAKLDTAERKHDKEDTTEEKHEESTNCIQALEESTNHICKRLVPDGHEKDRATSYAKSDTAGGLGSLDTAEEKLR